MTDSTDQAWLDGLAGRDGSSEGRALRGALREHARRDAEDAVVPDSSPAREFALIARARREGLLRPERSSAAALFGRWFAGWRGALVMAAVAGVAIVVGLSTGVPPVDETVRAPRVDSVMLRSQDPPQLRAKIVEALIDLDVDAHGYAMQGLEFVDANLPEPVPEEVEAVLERFGIAKPAGSTLRVVIARPTR